MILPYLHQLYFLILPLEALNKNKGFTNIWLYPNAKHVLKKRKQENQSIVTDIDCKFHGD